MKSVLVFAFTAGFHEACCLKKNKKKRQLSLHSAWRVEASLPSKQSQYRRINSQGFRQLSAKEKENLHQFTAELLYFICFSVGDVLWVCLRGTSSVTHPDSYHPRTLPQPLPETLPCPSPLEVAPSILQNAVRFCIPASATAPSHLSTPSHAHTSLPLPLCLLCLSASRHLCSGVPDQCGRSQSSHQTPGSGSPGHVAVS